MGLLFVKLSARVFITDSIGIGKRPGWNFVGVTMMRGWMVGCRVVGARRASRGGQGSSHKGRSEEDKLQFKMKMSGLEILGWSLNTFKVLKN